MHIGICSPRAALLEQQREALDEFVQTSCLDLTLHTFSDHAGLMEALSTVPLGILVYDTCLSESLEERVWEAMHVIPNCSLVLLGDDTRHALFGYAVRAAGYLLTPLNPEDLIDVLARLIREKMSMKEQFLPVRLEGVWSRLNMNRITYLESSKHSMLFHMDDGKIFRTTASYRDYQSLLALNRHFCRCHKSYVVNLRHVDSFDQSFFRLKDGEQVSISQSYRREARCYYARYITMAYDRDYGKPPKVPEAHPPSKAGPEAHQG